MKDNVFKALQLLEDEGYDTSLLKGSKEQIEEINDINESAIKNATRFLDRQGFDVYSKNKGPLFRYADSLEKFEEPKIYVSSMKLEYTTLHKYSNITLEKSGTSYGQGAIIDFLKKHGLYE